MKSCWLIDRNLAGTLGIFDINRDIGSGEIGYWLGAEYEGPGTITPSCRKPVSCPFETLDLNRIVIRCQPDNSRSSALAKWLGFLYEGTLRYCSRHNDELHDLEVYLGLCREREQH